MAVLGRQPRRKPRPRMQREPDGSPFFRAFEQWTTEGALMAELNDLYEIQETLVLDEEDELAHTTRTIQACVEGQVVSEYDLLQFEARWGKRPKVAKLGDDGKPAARDVKAPEPKAEAEVVTSKPKAKKASPKKSKS